MSTRIFQPGFHSFGYICDKYPVPEAKSERVRLFTAKLQDKKQSLALRQRAANAVSLYFQMESPEKRTNGNTSQGVKEKTDHDDINHDPLSLESSAGQPHIQAEHQTVSRDQPHNVRMIERTSNFNEAGYQEKSDSPAWDEVLNKMAGEIKVRHYSRKTLKTYANWSRRFRPL